MCGIFGITGHEDAARLAYFGLYALQHRGQESAGIVSWDEREGSSHLHVGMGLVPDVFKEEDLKALGQRVEEDLRSRGLAQVKSEDVGRAILEPLRELDVVAYLRFASVYQNFEDLEDFQRAIDSLKSGGAAA